MFKILLFFIVISIYFCSSYLVLIICLINVNTTRCNYILLNRTTSIFCPLAIYKRCMCSYLFSWLLYIFINILLLWLGE
uniref:Clone ZZD865 mRNA sequence n=1 Tax=Schistosoma japonicum TaxID=6182 RepID=Q86E77_SCHJA|nr:hypothetical protein [Schistosoma japonicum]